MTILYRSDWTAASGSPRAIIHDNTSNRTFTQMTVLLNKMGVKNDKFHLALYDKDLKNIDVHNLKDDSRELKYRIMNEVTNNIWYYLREVVRIPMSGGDPISFQLHRSNLCMAWLYFNDLTAIHVIPRQKGKTWSAITLASHVILFSGHNVSLGMLAKDATLVYGNVSRFKDVRDNLPKWMIAKNKTDIDNKAGLTYTKGIIKQIKNHFLTYIAQDSEQAAYALGRGLSLASILIDEFAYIKKLGVTFSQLILSSSEAGRLAKMNGQRYGHIYTTTAGRPDTEVGGYAYKLYKEAMVFNEHLYDTENREDTVNRINMNSINGYVNATFSFLQLGETHEWLREQVRKSQSDDTNTARDLLNIWLSGKETSILREELIKRMKSKQIQPKYIEITNGGYTVNWYVPESVAKSAALKNKPLIMGADTSDMVGRDFTSFVIIDPSDLSTIATFRCNDDNLLSIGLFFASMLISFPKMIFIPERKSSGAAIIDTICLSLIKNGFNPFLKIFNSIVQDKQEKFDDVSIHDTSLLNKGYKKHLGFITTGKSRPFLFKHTLSKATRLAADRIYDSTIITELSGLSVVNGRIDHSDGANDDTAFAWLLACWLVFSGKNLHMYGIDVNNTANALSETGTAIDPLHRQRQLQLKEQINHYMELRNRTTDITMKNVYSSKITALSRQIDDDIDLEPISVDILDGNITTYNNNATVEKTNVDIGFLTNLIRIG